MPNHVERPLDVPERHYCGRCGRCFAGNGAYTLHPCDPDDLGRIMAWRSNGGGIPVRLERFWVDAAIPIEAYDERFVL